MVEAHAKRPWFFAISAGCLLACGTAPYELGEGHAIAEPAVPRSPLGGRWSGSGWQSDGHTWRIEVDVVSVVPGMCAHVRYPDIDCAAYWTCTEVGENELHAFEHVTQGRDRCVDNEVELSRGDDGTVTLLAHAGDLSAEAHLTR